MNEMDLPNKLEDQSKKEESPEELLRRKEKLKEQIYYINEYLKKLYQVRETLNTIRSIILKSLNQLDQTYPKDYDKILDYLRYLRNFTNTLEFLIENLIKPYINDNDIKEDLKKYKPHYIELEKRLEDINNKFKDLHETIIRLYFTEKHYEMNKDLYDKEVYSLAYNFLREWERDVYLDSLYKYLREQLRKSHLKEVFSRLHYIRSELSDLSNTLCDIIDDICSYYLDFLIEKKENEIKKLEEEAGLRSQQRGIFQPSKQPTPAPLYYIDEYLKKLYQVREILNTIRSIILKSLNQLDRTYLQDYQDYNKILDYVRYFENFIGIWEFLIENFIKPYINDNDIKEDLEKYKPDYIELEKKLEDINNKFKDLHEIIIKIEIYLLDIIEEFKKYEYIGEQVSEVYLKKVEVNLKKIFDRLNSLKSELSVLLNTLYDILDQICRYYLEPLMEKKENEIKKSEKEAGLRSQQRGIFQFLKQPTPPSQPSKQPTPPSQPSKQPTPP
ncbi:MAG: hypothetical protein QXN76_00345, partial [Nanopusillaceae archaeon]